MYTNTCTIECTRDIENQFNVTIHHSCATGKAKEGTGTNPISRFLLLGLQLLVCFEKNIFYVYYLIDKIDFYQIEVHFKQFDRNLDLYQFLVWLYLLHNAHG